MPLHPFRKGTTRYLLVTLTGLLLIFAADQLGIFAGFNNYCYDLFFRVRGERPPDASIVIAAVDEKTLGQLGRWPISRTSYIRLLDRTKEARAVAFDIIMSESAPEDPLLAEAIRGHGRVIFPVYIDNRLQAATPVVPLAGVRVGHIHVEPGIDGMVRQVYHWLFLHDRALPSFALVIQQTLTSGKALAPPIPPLFRVATPADAIDQAGVMLINHYGPSGCFPHIPLADIVAGSYPAEFFRDKIVVVGITAAGLGDVVLTPFTQQRNKMRGVELQAAILNNLMDDSAIRALPVWPARLIALLLSLAYFALFMRLSEWRATIAWMVSLALLALLSFALFSLWDVWLAPAVLCCSFTFMYLMTYFFRLDETARKLDLEYDAIASLLGFQQPVGGGILPRKGLLGVASAGRINRKIEMITKVADQLVEVDKFKSMFIASMSHELRTPLNSIIGFSSIMQNGWMGPINSEQKESLGTVLHAGKHLLSIINDIIDVSKIEAGKVDIRTDEADLFDVVGEAVELVAQEAREKGLQLTVENFHQQIRTDRRRLLQCILNLLSNAVKYTLEGGITVKVRIVAQASHSGTAGATQASAGEGDTTECLAEISVADTGVGIREQDVPKIFQSFVRLDAGQKANVPGTGLGLYLARKLATEVLHGDITFASEFGKGSIFALRIPTRLHLAEQEGRQGGNDESVVGAEQAG